MNQKGNLLIFVLASVVMLFLYQWMMTKNAQQRTAQPLPSATQTSPVQNPDGQTESAAQPSPASASDVATLVAPPPPTATPALPAEPVDRAARFQVSNDCLTLTWRQYDGALVQAVWKQDGTRFFPIRERDGAGRLISAEFLGLGGSAGTVFRGEPRVLEEDWGKTVVFENQETGEELAYRLPNGAFVLDVEWRSPKGNGLWLIRSLAEIPVEIDPSTGAAYPANPFQGLENGRVFTLEERDIHAVAWGKILEDPWFMFLGRRRKELPLPLPRLGMDAGFEASKRQVAHYFAAIWDASIQPQRILGAQPGYITPVGADGKTTARLYLGPKQAEYLATFHPEGEPEKGKIFLQTMDFGFFGLIAKLMFMMLKFVQGFIPNWGWAIVTFGFLLRVALWPLNTKTTLGMLRMKDLEPHQKAIQNKYAKFGGDMVKKQEMQRELMAFYKKNGHNPMGSCLPMLLQMPIFMALWSMLQNVFELRHAPWVFWIKDLSAPDSYFILPALMVGSMIAQQAMTPPMGDPQQRKMMMVVMPIMMGFFFAYTPAGLTVYYLIYNIVGMGQTWWLMRNYKPQPVVV